MKAKVKTLMLWPSRTVDLGPGRGYAKLSAGLELEFPKPVNLTSVDVKEALKEARQFINQEFRAQYEPYRVVKKDSKK